MQKRTDKRYLDVSVCSLAYTVKSSCVVRLCMLVEGGGRRLYTARYLSENECHCSRSHCGVAYNVRAERLAKEGSECEQANKISFFDKMRLIQTDTGAQCQASNKLH